MGKCVLCGKLSNNKEKATLHKFPRDEKLCKQWIEMIGQEGWVPTKSSFVCSDHFTDDCFTKYDGRTKKKLIPGKIPTILTKPIQCEPPESSDVLVESTLSDDAGDTLTPIIIENIAGLMEIEHTACFTNTTERLDQAICLPDDKKLKQKNRKKNVDKKQHEKILHDHRYQIIPHNSDQKLIDLRKKLDWTMKENKMLRQRVVRLKQKVDSLKNVVKALNENNV